LQKKWRAGAVRPLVFRIQQGVLRTSPEFTQGGVWQRARERMLVLFTSGLTPAARRTVSATLG